MIDASACVRQLWEIIDRLRGENGCPWDRQQTPDTVKEYIIEEAHEAVAAVRSGDVEEIKEELGDILFMVLFMVHLYQEQGDFTLGDVCEAVKAKMIRRHPHVFGTVQVNSAEDVKDNWQKIKKSEKKHKSTGIPPTLPALLRAYRMLSRGLLPESRLTEEEVRRELLRIADGRPASKPLLADELARLLILLVQCGRLYDIKAEDALHKVLDLYS
ncbi:MazG family protein [Thermodesulforhabdus norvegica]|uniref:Tetrapyrrole methylase family protein / MazG family protein n=1 Tax=Thermodesulforhabdus norvegica TaxID=39841 RepID=A0A1I4RG54_9BACT|nr:MazG family protein [Thermodesulforhabdus norvegica]SFM50933.1 tetrapyrrole methylase family protein / MazG family protein [Thermodesulforhabdus norvegica]